jgi:bifunctional NMN adenylyltransferase/nudix hydrolase
MSDVAFVIGRFQPYHRGHHALIHRAFQSADHVVVIIGDTGCRPDFRNPWTFEEREEWIETIWNNEKSEHQHITCLCVEDIPYDDAAWVKAVKEAVAGVTDDSKAGRRTLIGHNKDDSSFYLKLFPEWEYVEVVPEHTAGATLIRELFFSGEWPRVEKMLHPVVWKSIKAMPVDRYHDAQGDWVAIQAHDAEWDSDGAIRYGVQHVAVDALLYSDTHVLLIERGGEVGNGAWAMPGGFVNKGERLLDAALRELEEETGIRLNRSDYSSHGIGTTVAFDHPRRSMRGRIFTNVMAQWVDHTQYEPKAADDAAKAFWFPIADLKVNKRKFFSDHWHIINYFVGE